MDGLGSSVGRGCEEDGSSLIHTTNRMDTVGHEIRVDAELGGAGGQPSSTRSSALEGGR